MAGVGDPFDLNRFLAAQEGVYPTALAEIVRGRKRSHWMWYLFPQIDGLGFSAMSKRYAIKYADEARAYLEHPILGMRLRECAEALCLIEGRSASQIFGSPDDMKLRSCLTLFAAVSPRGSLFHELLENRYQGGPDEATLRLLGIKLAGVSPRTDFIHAPIIIGLDSSVQDGDALLDTIGSTVMRPPSANAISRL